MQAVKVLESEYQKRLLELDPKNLQLIEEWPKKVQQYKNDFYIYKVRGKEIKIATHYESLSHTLIPKISTPRYTAWGDLLQWIMQENVPGDFPLPQEFIRSREKEKTQHECLLAKADQSEPTNVFIMFLSDFQQNVCQRHLIL